jgi:hypothetical protein
LGASETPRGAYGLRFDGLDAGLVLQAIDASATSMEISVVAELPSATGPHVTLPYVDGTVLIELDPIRISLRLDAARSAAELVHPYLSAPAAIVNRWLGREPLHAGAIVLDDQAWGVLGGREAGKSTTMAQFSLFGVDIVTDDLLVVDGGLVHAGPRCIDLRAGAAERLEVGEPLGVVGTRERWRLQLTPVAPTVPLAGFIHLEWGEEFAIERLPVAERPGRLVHQAAALLVGDPSASVLLDLAALPTFVYRRPADWARGGEVVERLLDHLRRA